VHGKERRKKKPTCREYFVKGLRVDKFLLFKEGEGGGELQISAWEL